VLGWGGLSVISFVWGFFGGFFFVLLFVVVVVYLSICFQFNRKLPFEK
jgi:uncharacterized membrane protein YgaE (UPF0421/DUF939 family)